jgi:hypothetical protein
MGLLSPAHKNAIAIADELGFKIAVIGGLKMVPGLHVAQAVLDHSLVPAVFTAVGQRRRFPDHDFRVIDLEHRLDVPLFHGSEEPLDDLDVALPHLAPFHLTIQRLSQPTNPSTSVFEDRADRLLEVGPEVRRQW